MLLTSRPNGRVRVRTANDGERPLAVESYTHLIITTS